MARVVRCVGSWGLGGWGGGCVGARNESLNIWKLVNLKVLCTTVPRTKFDWDV